MVNEITIEDFKELKRLINLSRANSNDKNSCLNLMKKYVDERPALCLTCGDGVRRLFERMKDYYNRIKNKFNE